MNINGVGPQNAHANQIIKNQNANTAVEDDEQDDLNTMPAIEGSEEETDNGNGVINNLLNGHYKSIPAMRLYLNHYEKIAAANSEQTDPIVAESIDNIQGLAGDIQGFIDSQQPGDDQSGDPSPAVMAETDESTDIVSIFNAAVEQTGQNFINSTNPQTDSLVTDLQNAFDALVAGLTPPEPAVTNEPIVPEEPVVPQEPVVPEEPTEPALIAQEEPLAPTPAEQFEEFIAGLTAAFSGFLDTLQENLANANTITLPAAESFTREANNGSAYDKFLEMYSQLPGVPTAPVPTVPAPPPAVEQSGLA